MQRQSEETQKGRGKPAEGSRVMSVFLKDHPWIWLIGACAMLAVLGAVTG